MWIRGEVLLIRLRDIPSAWVGVHIHVDQMSHSHLHDCMFARSLSGEPGGGGERDGRFVSTTRGRVESSSG